MVSVNYMLNVIVKSTWTNVQFAHQVSFTFTCKVKGKATDSDSAVPQETTPAPVSNVEAKHTIATPHDTRTVLSSDAEDEVRDSEEDLRTSSEDEDLESAAEEEQSFHHRLVVSDKRSIILPMSFVHMSKNRTL